MANIVERDCFSMPSHRKQFEILGVNVDAVSMNEAVARVMTWVDSRATSKYVTFTNVHSVMEARKDPGFQRILNSAAMVSPDGMPLVWLGRRKGLNVEHVCGPDFLTELLRQSEGRRYRHFFLGGVDGVPERLASNLQDRFPQMEVVGTYSPPFRTLTKTENEAIIQMLNEASPDLLWVGLGCPKQERWMNEFAPLLRIPVILGVGQAFDIYAGNLRQSPRWMRDNGFEWLYRLCSEPRRLWRRYLMTNVGFAVALLAGKKRGAIKTQ